MKKKMLTLVLAVSLVFSLCGCNYEVKVGDKVIATSEDAVEEEPDSSEKAHGSGKSLLDSSYSDDDDSSYDVASVTAESLLSQTYDDVESVSQKIEMVMDFEEKMDADSATDVSATIKLHMNAQIDSTKHTEHYFGIVNMEMSGMTFDVPIETYTDIDAGITYESEYDMSTGTTSWTKSNYENGSEKTFGAGKITSKVKDATVSEVNNSYIVEGYIPSSEFDDIDVSEMTGIETVETQVPIICTYDKDTKYLTAMNVDLTAIIPSSAEIAVNKCEISTTLFNYNEVDVLIPDTVITSASTSSDFINDSNLSDSGAGSTFEVDDDLCLAQAVMGVDYVDSSDVYEGWLYQYPGVGASYELGSNGVIDEVLYDLSTYLSYYTEKDLIEELEYIEYYDDYKVAALLLLGDLEYLEDDYRSALEPAFQNAGLTNGAGANIYLDLCGLK